MSMFLSNRPVQKVLLKNTTRLSLHERFTYLRNNVAEASGSGTLQRQRDLQQQAARNRRIAMQMERRPAVMAALKLKKKSLRQRLGMSGAGAAGIGNNGRIGTSIKDRLSLGRPGRRLIGSQGVRGLNRSSLQQSSQIRRGRQRGRGLQSGGGAPRGRLSRSQSTQSINNAGRFANRVRSRSRSRSRVGTNSLNNNNINNGANNQRFRNRIRGVRGGGNPRFMQQKQRGRGGGLNTFRGRGGNWGTRGRGDRGKGMRGGLRRGRGGQRGLGGRRQNAPAPTKEELDNQLDQYMANSRFSLDKDLDTYMKQATSLGTTSAGATPMEESWD